MKVSVLMITYGHEKYIRQAIESVLDQECNFNYELVIANDCSPDSSDEIINQVIRNHSKGNLIKYIKHSKNIGMQLNYIDAFQKCRGKYIANCEGDDYWTDPLKLQKQVDFLEINEKVVISCCNSNVVNIDGSFIKKFNETNILELTDTNFMLRNSWYIPTASIVFRNINFEIPEWFFNCLNGDYALCLILTSNGGLVHYDEEVRSSYRLHEGGVSNVFINSKNNKVYNYSMLYINKMFNGYSNGSYYPSIKKNIEKFSLDLLYFSPINSKEFWKITIDLIWFNKGLSKEYFLFVKNKFLSKIRTLKKNMIFYHMCFF